VELAERMKWRLCKKMLRIHSIVANGEGDSEPGIQRETAKILSLLAKCWAKVKQSWKEKTARKHYKRVAGKRKV